MKRWKVYFTLKLWFIFFVMTTVVGCAAQRSSLLVPEGPGTGLVEITDHKLYPQFRDDYDKESLLLALDNSLEYFNRKNYKSYGFHMRGFTREKLKETLEFFRNGLLRCKNSQELNDFVVENFRVFQAVGEKNYGKVLFTGYATPIYEGSLVPNQEFHFPLYSKPDDFKKPYYKRKEIEGRNLLRGHELVYLKSRLNAYLIHVQGSGQIDLASGGKLYVGYAADSGHEYTSIGQQLVLDGKIPEEELTLPALIDYFDKHPEELDYYIKKNDRFIFFQTVNYATPHGSIGVPVTPMRSIATDKDVFPAGALAFAMVEPKTKKSNTFGWFQNSKEDEEMAFFVLDQDTGSAIQTPALADIYFGIGDNAMSEAGGLNTYGKLYYLLKR